MNVVDFLRGDARHFDEARTDADPALRELPSWHIGTRDAFSACDFMRDLAPRLAGSVQLTTDGYKAYPRAVEGAYASDVDYAMLVKAYGPAMGAGPERRYSPAQCIGAVAGTVRSKPDPDHISTSHVERQNLSMRMAAGVTDKLWSLDDIASLVEAYEPVPKKRGAYKKRAVQSEISN